MAATVIEARAWTPASARVQRMLLLLGLGGRIAYCFYATAVVTLNETGYRRPVLAAGALLTVLVTSAVLGARIWSGQVVSHRIAAVDVAVGGVTLIALAAAIERVDRSGSLNWALAYAVGCVAWLALGHGRHRLWLAGLLGVVEGVTVLAGQPANAARTVTTLVNATSMPLYFAVFTVVVVVIRRTALEVDTAYEREQRQNRETAALTERERLFGDLHASVVDALDRIATGDPTAPGVRAMAALQAGKVRRAFAAPASETGALTGQLVKLIHDRARAGWRIDLVDEELDGEPPDCLTEPLCAALAQLINGTAPADSHVRLRLQADRTGAQIVVRAAGRPADWAEGCQRAQAVLADAGSLRPMPGLPHEIRLCLRVPA